MHFRQEVKFDGKLEVIVFSLIPHLLFDTFNVTKKQIWHENIHHFDVSLVRRTGKS